MHGAATASDRSTTNYGLLVVVLGQLQQIHARCRRGELPVRLMRHLLDADLRIERGEAQQRLARAARDEPQEVRVLSRRELVHALPERLDVRLARVVAARIGAVRLQVVQVDGVVAIAADQKLHLRRVEEAEPADRDELPEALQHRLALRLREHVELEVRQEVDVLQRVLRRHRNVLAVGHQAHVVMRPEGLDVGLEVQAQIRHGFAVRLPRAERHALHAHQPLVEALVEELQVVHVVVPAQQLVDERRRQARFHQDAFVERLPQDAPREAEPIQMLRGQHARGVGRCHLVRRAVAARAGGHEVAIGRVEDLLADGVHPLLQKPTPVDAGLLHAVLVDKSDLDAAFERLAPDLVLAQGAEAVLKNVVRDVAKDPRDASIHSRTVVRPVRDPAPRGGLSVLLSGTALAAHPIRPSILLDVHGHLLVQGVVLFVHAGINRLKDVDGVLL
eukprot:scaffold655_cov225-Pinguiococcus_pyrenoidosus.AAC.12